MGEVIRLVDDPCIECAKCGSQTWYVMVEPDTPQEIKELHCGNPDCDAIIPFEDEEELVLELE